MTRFQQTCGPVMAKGVEDTAFYRYLRLAALNEVGGDPGRFGLPVAEFHEACAAQQRDWPLSQTTLSTHDTKRSEDVRARLVLLAQAPREWGEAVVRWTELGARHRSAAGPDRATELLVWQSLLGCLADQRRPGGGVRREGHPRGQGPHVVGGPGAGVRRGRAGVRPGRRSGTRRSSASWTRSPSGCARRGRPRCWRRSWCSSRCRASPTPTRAPSCRTCRWSTRTTGGRSTRRPAAPAWPTSRPRRPSSGSPRPRCGCGGTTRSGSWRTRRTSRWTPASARWRSSGPARS